MLFQRILACAGRLAVASAPLRAAPVFIKLPASPPRRALAVHAGTFKTPSSIKKRFRVSASGEILRSKGGKSHLNRHKSSARINRLGKVVALVGGIRARYLRALQLGKLLAR